MRPSTRSTTQTSHGRDVITEENGEITGIPVDVEDEVEGGGQEDPPDAAADELRKVVREEMKKVYEALDKKLEENNTEFSDRVKGHINHLKQEFAYNESPHFKLKSNERHHARSQRYLRFCLEIRSAICDGDEETALASLDALIEAIKSFQKDVSIADKYEGGWVLVDRFRGHADESEEATLRKLNEKILEERAASKRKASFNNGPEKATKTDFYANIFKSGPSREIRRSEKRTDERPQTNSGGQSKTWGPCIWCKETGHGYKVS